MICRHNSFGSAQGGIEEHFFSVTPDEPMRDFREELEAAFAEYRKLCTQFRCSKESEFLLRLHLSDPANQIEIVKEAVKTQAHLSLVGQAPANRARIALEAWHWCGKVQNYHPFWFQSSSVEQGSFAQTTQEFEELQTALTARQCTIENHTVRTWLYCRDVDNNYAGLVRARNEFFARHHLTAQTHFIASTGIEGVCPEPSRLVRMDSLSMQGVKPEQQIYLSAPEMLSPTALYGVSFERGTRLLFGDRSHYYISGTASIDKEGKVLHLGDVRAQTRRLVQNIGALLESSEGRLEDIKWGTLYLRDIADVECVQEELFRAGMPESCAFVTVKAPVCRPAWLVEMECLAVNEKGNGAFPVLA